MDKRSWQYTLLALAGLFLCVVAFFHYFEYVEKKAWVGFDKDKDSQTYYLAGQFLREQGIDVRFVKTVNQVFPLPSTDSAIFLAQKTDYLSEKQALELVNWVEAGGQLVLYADIYDYWDDSGFAEHEIDKRYSLLDRLGIWISRCDCSSSDSDEKDEIDNELETGIEEILEDNFYGNTITIPLPNQQQSIAIGPAWRSDIGNIDYDEASLTPLLEVKKKQSDTGLVLATYQLGQGQVTVHFTSSYLFSDNLSNTYYFEEDEKDLMPLLMTHNNSGYLLYLLGNIALPKELIIVERGVYYSITQLIKQHALMIVISIALLILAWLWFSLSRFGSIKVENHRQSLSMAKHIQATGEFLTKDKSRARLIEACYKSLDRDIYQKIDSNRLISQDKLIDKIALRTQLPKNLVSRVMHREYPDSDKDYLQLIHDILTIREKL